ncbi:MAG TPA: PIG-L family deacetylase [Candidatus Cryosericum sp.]|nr:PIG-L family deacetylase [Candidatus Cryosericum sp.]
MNGLRGSGRRGVLGALGGMGLVAWLSTGTVSAQAPARPDAAEIRLALKKLQVLASVLYVAAHPDDENTRLIAYLGKGRLADAAYLSMTRGDGGQNLLGPEIGDLLGIIRSQELLAARRIDGGRQFFTRAIDFGFSKSPEETLRIWDQEQVLADTVRVFRRFQPDVVITRFPDAARATHGHHTASARLAREAMAAAGDPKRFTDQLDRLAAWRPKRLLWNTSSWFYDKSEEFNPAVLLKLDVGGYNPLLGESYTELAARSRSMHRTQGFGSSGARGEVLEYLEHVDGDRAQSDLFDGIDTTWGRIAGGKAVGEILARALREFDPESPARVVPVLLEARKKLLALPAGRWKESKQADLDQTIAACLGLYLEAAAETWSATPGGKVKVNLEAANRSALAVRMKRFAIPAAGVDEAWEQDLGAREAQKKSIEVALPEGLPDSQPYWLREKGTLGMFRVDDPGLIGRPENPPALTVLFGLEVGGVPFALERPVVHKWTDPAFGEKYRPFEVLPPVAIAIADGVLVFPETAARQVAVTLRATAAGAAGTLRLEAPAGWTTLPPSREFLLAETDATTTLEFEVRPPDAASEGVLRAVAETKGRRYQRGLLHIEPPHIPTQVVLPPAEARVVRLSLGRRGQTIGYVQGAGDQVPAGLRQIGYSVEELRVDDLTADRLRAFDAVILGVRAYNTLEGIRSRQPALFEYAKAGGTVIVQYNTSHELHVDAPAPYPLKISRDRVSEEAAEVRFLLPDHPALNVPNKITPADFEGWVQERGLYFASEWDGAFQAVLSCNDTGEPPRDGGLLVAKHGKGFFVYTGYSWFRQIPAGVPGAFRLFANLIALGN